MKNLKIILINLLLFLLLFHVVDFYFSLKFWQCNLLYKKYDGNRLLTYFKHYNEFHNYSTSSTKHQDNEFNNLVADAYDIKSRRDSNEVGNNYRPIENKFATNSIILFGCSYVYGLSLYDNETFSAGLGSLLPNYEIYNRGKNCWTTSHMLYQLENKDFLDVPNVKFLIYIFMPDHFVRNCYSYMNILTYTPYYKLTNSGTLQFQEYSLKYIQFPILYIVKQMYKDSVYNRLYTRKEYKEIELTKKILKNSKLEIDQKFPNARFIILRYDKGKEEPYNEMFEELKQEGIIVVTLNDLSDKNYIDLPYQLSITDIHPNARAWEEITPLFVKYLRDNGYLQD